jgi:hypothetical protein
VLGLALGLIVRPSAPRFHKSHPTPSSTLEVKSSPCWSPTLPNFSICGRPYDLSGDVTDWRDLAHRTHRRPRAGAYDKAEARLRGLGGTVARFARALVRHGRALAA